MHDDTVAFVVAIMTVSAGALLGVGFAFGWLVLWGWP